MAILEIIALSFALIALISSIAAWFFNRESNKTSNDIIKLNGEIIKVNEEIIKTNDDLIALNKEIIGNIEEILNSQDYDNYFKKAVKPSAESIVNDLLLTEEEKQNGINYEIKD